MRRRVSATARTSARQRAVECAASVRVRLAALLAIPLLFALAICIADPSFAQRAQAATDDAIAVQSAADYPVGFTVITLRDSSRAWERLPNAVVRGKASLFIPRPVRISVWYPARAESGPHMRVADYLTHAGITDSLAQRVSQKLDARDHRTFIAQALDGATGTLR